LEEEPKNAYLREGNTFLVNKKENQNSSLLELQPELIRDVKNNVTDYQ
jgi:hypothetical protein